MGELVSIIMPVYNTKAFLEDSVRSVMRQTYPDWELLMIDDGSTDGSAALCDRLAAEDARIRVFHQKNAGVSSARNLAISHMKGDAVCFLDSDDLYEPDYLKKMQEMREAAGGLPACCGFYAMTAEEESAPARPMPAKRLPLDDFLFETLIGNLSLPVSCWVWIFPAEAVRQHRFDEKLRYSEDSLFVCEVLSGFDTIWYDPVPLYHYRIDRAGNTLSVKSFAKYVSEYRSLTKIRQAFGGRLANTEQVLTKHLLERSASAARAAKREGLKKEMRQYKALSFGHWKQLLSCGRISWKDKVRLLFYSLFPMLSEKVMVRIYGRV